MKPILKRTLTTVAVVAALAVAPLANATNGYFKIGYGSKNRGMAGAGIAFGQDSLASAVNPAALSGMGNRVDAGVELFNPQREGSVDATLIGGASSSEDSGATVFAIPNFGVSMDLGGSMTAGLSVVANGGMNTRYGDANDGTGNTYFDAFAGAIGGFVPMVITQMGGNPANPLDPITQLVGGHAAKLGADAAEYTTLGVNLSQVLITPTIAYNIDSHNAVGFSPVIAYQRFRAYGLGLFKAFSSNPDKLTNNGDDQSWGYGARVGYQGTFGMFTIGASYTSKLNMEAFDNYAGLFAEKGDFDIPSTYGVGIAIHPTSGLTLAVDVSRINYSDVAAINNPGPTADEFFQAFGNALATGGGKNLTKALGKNNGWGFGWDDITVYKVGVNYVYNSKWTYRAGFNYAESPYGKDQALFNVLAPGLVEKHATVGFTYSPSTTSELTVAYMHAFRNSVDNTYHGGKTIPTAGDFTGFDFSATNAMSQNSIEASYAWKF